MNTNNNVLDWQIGVQVKRKRDWSSYVGVQWIKPEHEKMMFAGAVELVEEMPEFGSVLNKFWFILFVFLIASE